MKINDLVSILAAHPEGRFLDIDEFNGHQVGACRITGTSPVWEMHPDTDELFYILDGQFEITLLPDDGGDAQVYRADAGHLFVVPKGVWHKPAAPDGAHFFYLTPGESLHSDTEDPRRPSS